MMQRKPVQLALGDFEQQGLYLLLPDETKLILTRENVRKVTDEYWNSLDKIPLAVRQATEFQRCPFCPLKGQNDICDALRPVLPFLAVLDKYNSYDRVTVVYKGGSRDVYQVADISIQEGLKYLSILALTQYCQMGKRFWKYYFDIIPIMEGEEFAARLYLNIYWLYKGDQAQIKTALKTFDERTRIACGNQVRRLSLICKNDAFMGAFASMQAAVLFLALEEDIPLQKAFEAFGNMMPD
jgi:hypothetical protein